MSTLPTMGCDTHLDTITAAVVDRTGAELAAATVPNSQPGWDELVAICRQYGTGRVGIEGASGYGRRLAQTLNVAGLGVVEIPTRITARTRRVDGAGKTDPGDARTVARAAARGDGHRWTDRPGLEAIRVLVARRDRLVRTQTGDINQLRALLVELDPHQAAQLGRLRSARSFQALCNLDTSHGDLHRRTVATLITEIAADCLTRLAHIRRLEHRIGETMPPVGHALIDRHHGCGVIVAAQILAHVAGTDGFATDAHMAAWAGTAPLDASSGRQQRHRLNRSGNRQINRALHTIILTQLRQGGQAADYIARKTSQGKTTREAIRTAKRHLTRSIWKTLRDYQLT